MWFVLVVAVIVIAGWIYMASNGAATRNSNTGPDDYVPVNAYDNPYDTNENNDRPFELDASGDASDDSCSDDSSAGDSSSD